MKISIDVDITPKELREFFGLPDVEPLQQEMLERLAENMRAGQEGYDPIALLKPLLPAHLQMMEQLQKGLWGGLSGGSRKDSDKSTE